MNTLKYALTLMLSVTICFCKAQGKLYPFNPDGSRSLADTGKVKTLAQYTEFTGEKHLCSDVLADKNRTLVLYRPLSYQPVLIFAKDSLAAVVALKSMNKTKYQNSYAFQSDFEEISELGYTRSDIIALLGEPFSEIEDEQVYTILSYPGFSIQCIKSSRPEYCTVDKLIRYDFTGAKKSGIGIADFHINLSDGDGDYVTGFRGSFLNMSTKKIKYLYITVRAENAVDDPVATKTAKAIGPILPNETGSYSYDNFFFSKMIESVRITTIKIQYFDGSIKIVTGPLLKGSFVEK
ncbi:hypothetical protein [Pedobacter sp. UC225_65]|uniref:hypothetical protein n=1 Tax=Pedobacter sp. UC225_65 TaxID=3350173 RepID=UPI00366B3CF2